MALRLTPNLCLYDPFEKGLQGAAEEIYHCAFPGANVTWTTNIAEALAGAKYLVSSGGAPRKEGMTREDLLKGNADAQGTWDVGEALVPWYVMRWATGVDLGDKAWVRGWARYIAYFIPPGTPTGVFGDRFGRASGC